MKKNVGNIDKAVRILIAIVLLSLYFVVEGHLRWISALAIIPMGTAFLGSCPLYSLFGISTSCEKK